MDNGKIRKKDSAKLPKKKKRRGDMQDIKARELSEMEIREVFKRLVTDHSDDFLHRFFRCAFQEEINHFALPANKRSYYMISINGRDEALFGINFRRDVESTQAFNISSFARIIEDDIEPKPASGWQYLGAILEEVLIPKCRENDVNAICANLSSKGGRQAFEELEKGRLPNGCIIEWNKGYPKTVNILVY
jgi:hypothetical protein